MAHTFLNLQEHWQPSNINHCYMSAFNLICPCGYQEKLVYKDKDYCPECGKPTIDIETHMITEDLTQENSTLFKQSFYQLSIEFDHEVNNYGIFIEYEYQLSFDFKTYTLQMGKFNNERLISTQETQLLNTQENFYQNIIKTFNSKIVRSDDQNTQNKEFMDNHFIIQLSDDFPSFVHEWVYFIFMQNHINLH